MLNKKQRSSALTTHNPIIDPKEGNAMTKRISMFSLLVLFTSTLVFAHAGEVHTYLGTITEVNADGSFVMKMTNGQDRTVLVSKDTRYAYADGRGASSSDLAAGKRVAAKISKDGKTALSVKLAAAKSGENTGRMRVRRYALGNSSATLQESPHGGTR